MLKNAFNRLGAHPPDNSIHSRLQAARVKL
jgi:hypothetical protein